MKIIYLIFLNKFDASIKSRDVRTTDKGYYATKDNIHVLNIVSLERDSTGIMLRTFYTLSYDNNSNTTAIYCYLYSSHVDNFYLDNYLDNRDKGMSDLNKNVTIYVYPNILNKAMNIRIYYINR